MLKLLGEEDLILIHNRIVDETGGLHGVRDQHAIRSVVGQPHQAVFGKELYPTIFLKAAVYARNIIAHHPFLDGNKRTGIAVASVFLIDNGFDIDVPEGGLYDLALHIAEDRWEYEDIAAWFGKYAKKAPAPKPRARKRG